jgi:putative nucleotidyltransferase with HDIG domain
MTILLAFLLLSFTFFLQPLSKGQWSFKKLLALCSVILISNVLLVKVLWFVYDSLSRNFVAPPFNEKSYFFFALPFASGVMLMALLTEERIALVFLIVNSVLLGQAVQSDFSGIFYILISSLVGILTVRNAGQRVGIVGSGFKLGVVAMGLFLVLQFSESVPMDFQSAVFGAALAFLSGPINATLLVFALPIIERLFLLTTEIRLSELGNHNLPLIRELILKAPGTYNQSIAVGTLAEGAAKAIGLNPLFVRVACLYHDIGKSVHPEYFIENQQGTNPHERLSPEESVKLLKEHVTEGIRMANAANLPPSIVDIIPQHHGTKPLTFFLEKAKKLAGADVIHLHQEIFRYPGPKPQSKEAAIIMLADGVEAAARALEIHNQETILALIQKIVSTTAEDGQLSECEITLADIERITFSFLETLSSFYHSRISYPGFDFNLREKGSTTSVRVTKAVP